MVDAIDAAEYSSAEYEYYQYRLRKMAHYSNLTSSERFVFMFLAIVTNLAMLPTIRMFYMNQPGRGKGTMTFNSVFLGVFTTFVSIMYHCSEAAPHAYIWMDEGKWHRLDNVGAIGGFGLLATHLADIPMEWRLPWEYAHLGAALILQEKAPWDLWSCYTPIFISLGITIIIHLYRYSTNTLKRDWDWRPFMHGIGFMAVAVFFFVRGLDDEHDYLRWQHSMWHVFLAAAYYHIVQVIPDRMGRADRKQKQLKTDKRTSGMPGFHFPDRAPHEPAARLNRRQGHGAHYGNYAIL